MNNTDKPRSKGKPVTSIQGKKFQMIVWKEIVDVLQPYIPHGDLNLP